MRANRPQLVVVVVPRETQVAVRAGRFLGVDGGRGDRTCMPVGGPADDCQGARLFHFMATEPVVTKDQYSPG